MIDIHCHILPGLDDGAASLDASLEMARMAATDGIRTIVATPHVKPPCIEKERIVAAVVRLNRELAHGDIPLKVLAGADCSASLSPPDFKHYTINGGPYVLVEFPYTHIPANARDVLFGLNVNGYLPIITHPERNPSVIRNPGSLFNLLDSGVKVQITAGSLTGEFGSDVAYCARYLIKKRVVHFLATDAHSPTHRRPVLSKGLRVARKIIGKDEADKLVFTNPRAVIAGERMDS